VPALARASPLCKNSNFTNFQGHFATFTHLNVRHTSMLNEEGGGMRGRQRRR